MAHTAPRVANLSQNSLCQIGAICERGVYTELSYPAIQLVPKPVDQRFVLGGPLVLSETSLKYQRLQQIKTNLSHDGLTYCSVIPNGTDYTLS